MYYVALCEDEAIFSEALEKTCRDLFNKLKMAYQITIFHSSLDFLKAFEEEQQRFDLVLLDIIMEGINGMELAQRVREADRKASIIFVTSSRDFVLQGYDVNALHYLMKPIDPIALERLLVEDYNRRFHNSFFLFDSLSGKVKAPIQEIICLETAGRRVEVTLTKGTVYFSGKLSALLEELPKKQFVRCHQAYAANISHIRELTKQDALTYCGKVIPVSRSFAKEVQKAFVRQLREG